MLTVTADHLDAIAQLDETTTTASRAVVLWGNKVQNGSFESSASGSAPDNRGARGVASFSCATRAPMRPAIDGLLRTWVD